MAGKEIIDLEKLPGFSEVENRYWVLYGEVMAAGPEDLESAEALLNEVVRDGSTRFQKKPTELISVFDERMKALEPGDPNGG